MARRFGVLAIFAVLAAVLFMQHPPHAGVEPRAKTSEKTEETVQLSARRHLAGAADGAEPSDGIVPGMPLLGRDDAVRDRPADENARRAVRVQHNGISQPLDLLPVLRI
ncbi:hypothetical protein [Kibdelosporangium phytohabitans]|uniref:Uncharacterized protein n=1 Tax=Kibdelosporangium phytohabitans TaxID=860235 RepID=A0A0N9I1P9_9PSEU|nr:hypothetical protein [Kibdelosporangium phytohabitans]ALG11496.1 hypothetical protein AOZ06_35655 [Kibdelosporangium phytohabitans]MBE1462848.1 hypothetical protein [Kibdelosporangium phytohabitans]